MDRLLDHSGCDAILLVLSSPLELGKYGEAGGVDREHY